MSRSSSSPIIYFEESGLDFYFFLFNYEFSVKNLVNQWRIVSTDSRPDVILLRGGAAAPTTEIFVSRTGCCSLHAAKILGALVSKLVNVKREDAMVISSAIFQRPYEMTDRSSTRKLFFPQRNLCINTRVNSSDNFRLCDSNERKEERERERKTGKHFGTRETA